MDKFKFTILINTLKTNPLALSLDTFEEQLLSLPYPEDYNTIHDALSYAPDDVDTARHKCSMYEILWHYR